MKHVFPIVGVFAALAGGAQGATVTMNFTGSGLYRAITIVDGSLGVSEHVAVGQLKWHVTASGYAPVHANTDIFTYCTDITQFVGNGPLTIVQLEQAPSPGAPMTSFRADLLRKLYNSSYADANTSAEKSAAFQLAIWEIVNESGLVDGGGTRGSAGLDLYAGDFHANNDSAARNRANTYLDAAFIDNTVGSRIVAGTSPVLQDQIFLAPLPTAAGLGLGGLALAGLRRRR